MGDRVIGVHVDGNDTDRAAAGVIGVHVDGNDTDPAAPGVIAVHRERERRRTAEMRD